MNINSPASAVNEAGLFADLGVLQSADFQFLRYLLLLHRHTSERTDHGTNAFFTALLPSSLCHVVVVDLGDFLLIEQRYLRLASHEGKDMGGFVYAAHR